MFSTSFSSFSKNMLCTLCYLIEFKLRKTFFFVIILVIVCSCNTKIFGISFALVFNAESSAIAVSFFVFVFFLRLHCNAKSFAIAIILFFFFFTATNQDGLTKVACWIFYVCYARRVWLNSDTLKKGYVWNNNCHDFSKRFEISNLFEFLSGLIQTCSKAGVLQKVITV